MKGRTHSTGIRIINLPSYRPELKSKVEKFFDCIQAYYNKPCESPLCSRKQSQNQLLLINCYQITSILPTAIIPYLICIRFEISREDWNCDRLSGKLVTDMGSEYKSSNFEQITDLGIQIINLPSYRPELKSKVENFFDCILASPLPHWEQMPVPHPLSAVSDSFDNKTIHSC